MELQQRRSVALRDDTREKMGQLEAALKELPEVELGSPQGNPSMPVKHHFANGVYCREIFLPKDSVCTGQIHRYETNNILVQGVVAVINPEEEPTIHKAPHVWQSPPFSKRAVVAVEDAIWITTHPVDKSYTESDLDKIFKEVIAEDFDDTPKLECVI